MRREYNAPYKMLRHFPFHLLHNYSKSNKTTLIICSNTVTAKFPISNVSRMKAVSDLEIHTRLVYLKMKTKTVNERVKT